MHNVHISYILHFAFFCLHSIFYNFICIYLHIFAYFIFMFHVIFSYFMFDIFIFHMFIYLHISIHLQISYLIFHISYLLFFIFDIFRIFHIWYFACFICLTLIFLCFAQVNKTFLVTLNGVLAVCSGAVLGLLNPCQETQRRFVSYFIEFHLY